MKLRGSKKHFQYLLSVILIIFTINTIRSILEANKNVKKLQSIQTEVEKQIVKNANTKKQIDYVQTDKYIRKAALEQLNLTEPGYKILIMNEKEPEEINTQLKTSKKEDSMLNWENWLNEFNL